MSTDIKCPKCGHEFEPTEAIRVQLETELKNKVSDWQKKKNEEFQIKLEEEKRRFQENLEASLRQKIASDFENKFQQLEQTNKENEERLKEARSQQVMYLKKEQELKTKEVELEIKVQQQLQQEREKLADEIRKLEEQRIAAKETEFQLRMKEMEEKMDAQKRLIEEMKRRAEQGSMQTQGEVQELLLEELLKNAFPFDQVTPVGKGTRGADCVLTVRNQFGQECGKIIFESKRTKDFSQDWIEKLKADLRQVGADAAILVTQAFPKDMKQFGDYNGVWICSFSEVKAVVPLMREGLIKVYNASKSQENKGDKMHMLYNYLTGNEFAEQWKAIREGFLSMKLSIQKERDAMEKLWKQREKQLEKILLNAAHIHGSVEGIAGADVNLKLDDGNDDLQLPE